MSAAPSRAAFTPALRLAAARAPVHLAFAAPPRTLPARLALLGTGNVGRAVLARLAGWRGTPFGAHLTLVHAASSRLAVTDRAGLRAEDVAGALTPIAHDRGLDAVAAALHGPGPCVVVDATASDAVAARHAAWLEQGLHVVTACKLGQGADLARWRAIHAARARGGTTYGDRATVGAGLPLLRPLRELVAGGDRIRAIAGVLSGSLAWLCNRYDGTQPFSALVRAARAAGYTEPDPRDDLSGEDVRRKLLILARAAGFELGSDDVDVASLVPPALAAVPTADVDAALPLLDAPLRALHAAATARGEQLRFVARLEHGRATVGLASVPREHPLAGGAGTDNKVAIWSDRYRTQPLVIQGPGAGADITAAGLLDDVLAIARG